MTATMFCGWVNNELLPTSELPPGCPAQVTERTAPRWPHEIGFHPTSHKKGIYIDGHEHGDVVEYRKLFLQKLEILEANYLPQPACSDQLTAFRVGSETAARSFVLIYHDESTFHANEGQSVVWAKDGKSPFHANE